MNDGSNKVLFVGIGASLIFVSLFFAFCAEGNYGKSFPFSGKINLNGSVIPTNVTLSYGIWRVCINVCFKDYKSDYQKICWNLDEDINGEIKAARCFYILEHTVAVTTFVTYLALLGVKRSRHRVLSLIVVVFTATNFVFLAMADIMQVRAVYTPFIHVFDMR